MWGSRFNTWILGTVIERVNFKDHRLLKTMYLSLFISSLLFSSQIMAKEYCNVGFSPSGLIAAYADQLIKRSGKKRILKIYFGDRKERRAFYLHGRAEQLNVRLFDASTKSLYENLIRQIESKINLDFIFTKHLPMADIAVFLVCAPNKMKNRAGAFIYGGEKSYTRIILNVCIKGKEQTVAQQQQVFLHEFGHALGLEHPFDDRDGDCIYTTKKHGFNAVTLDFTLMAYAPPRDKENWPNWYKALDLIALEKIWGARP